MADANTQSENSVESAQPSSTPTNATQATTRQQERPFDSTVYALFFALGIGALFPWNAFISENEYFTTRFCGTSIEYDFESVFAIAYNVTNLCALLILMRVQHKCSEAQLVLPPAFLTSVVFVIMSAATLAVNIAPTDMYHITVLLVVISGSCSAPFIAGICTIGAQFPGVYLSGIFSGQAFAGVLVSATGWLTTWATSSSSISDKPTSTTSSFLEFDFQYKYTQQLNFKESNNGTCEEYVTDWGAFSYFAVAVLASLACVGSYIVLKRHPTAVAFQQEFARQAKTTTDYDEPVVGDVGDVSSDLRTHLLSDMVDVESQALSHEDAGIADVSTDTNTNMRVGNSTLGSVLWTVKWYAFSVWFNFAISLALFPAVVSAIKPVTTSATTNRLLGDLWLPTLFFVFNICDFLSRVVAGRFRLISRRALPYVCLARVFFVPLFLATNVGAENTTAMNMVPSMLTWSLLSHSNVLPLLLTVLLGLSNGYCQSLAMMYGPQSVHPKDSDTASTVMVFSLTLGLSCGSLLSFVII